MSTGNWSFLHEWVIYNYLSSRADEKTLRIKKVVSSGVLLGRPQWVRVDELRTIIGTTFPDIRGVKLKGEKNHRPAEVKFTTSLFNYHRLPAYAKKLEEFANQKGFILVASHDYSPNDLLTKLPEIDIFEIEIEDFITFCRENFARLLNKQIKAHSASRVWLMYQGPNFNRTKENIRSARESLIWCPTENLTGFDLAKRDRVIFYKTAGVATQQLQNKFKREGVISDKWILKELFIAEVRTKIFSRTEYYQIKKLSPLQQLWVDDPFKQGWRWNRVFEFDKIKVISLERSMAELYKNEQSRTFVVKAWEAYCFGKSRELSLQDYRNLLEVIA